MLSNLKLLPQTFKKGLVILKDGNPLILASSTAFFTTFSIAPIILILVNILSIYFKSELISKKLLQNIQTTLGEQPAKQIESIIMNFQVLESNIWFTLGGSVFFAFVATTLLLVIQQSIHILWHISIKSTVSWRMNFIERFKALVLILSLGLLFMASQLLDALVILLYTYLHSLIPSLGTIYLRTLNISLSSVVIIMWITTLFKYLPDAKVKWEVAFAGGILTGLLYMLGKFILHKILIHSNVATIFGASASFALILLFIFYSSFIVYYGASFTYAYGENVGKPIIPGKYADLYIEQIIETDEI